MPRPLAGALGLAAVASSAAAAPEFDVEYRAPEGCPAATDFRREVAARVTEVSRAPAHYAVRMERADARWQGTLTVTDDRGQPHTRTLRGPSCADVTHAVAFLTALALELGRLDEEPAPAPAPNEPPPPDRPVHASPAPPPPKGHAPGAPPWIPVLGIAGSARGGLGPTLRPGAEIFFALDWDRPAPLAPGFVLSAVFGANAGEQSMDLWLFGGRFAACPVRLRAGPVDARPCLGLELGAVSGRANAVASPRTNSAAWLAAEAAGAVRLSWPRPVFLEATAALVVPAIRAEWVVEPSRTLYSTPAATGRLAIAIGVRL